ncbi:hypothetical protein PGN35_027960 [Nodosilinea sp. PGN35]|uniref:hypothetical protein n=1 Tax=Nodosilinea sp. PGN35 TaxID=3020489 RepID=UPI0023B30CAF|nr:hypothetical protein [Nodosilinea sp. TSF1-S3]MDF0365274.1 hypothetical protein [Nodosilinea sp. TSF1-S3]
MPTYTYKPPVAELLSYGESEDNTSKDWPNYVQALGLIADHVPALIQMVEDEQLWELFMGNFDREDEFTDAGLDPDAALWAPIHAWRSLGQLQAVTAIPTLVRVLQRHDLDWCWEELPQVFGLMGAGALDPLEELLSTKIDYNNKITLIEGIGRVAKAFPDLRDRTVAALTRQLSHFKNHHRSVNGAIIAQLLDFKATEAVPEMEAAYGAKKVDEMFAGSWARVQIDLGLKQESDFTPEELAIHYSPMQEQMMANIRASLDRPKPSGLHSRRGISFEKPPEFKDIAAQANTKKPNAKTGFGGGRPSAPKKSKKK